MTFGTFTYTLNGKFYTIGTADLSDTLTGPFSLTKECSFCNQEKVCGVKSGKNGYELHNWNICNAVACQSAVTICENWLDSGGINDSQSLRNDALRTANQRIENAKRRY